MDFNDVVGQKEIKAGLLNAIARNRVGHAYIFNGPVGIGKRMVAGIFAGLLLCSDLQDGKACGRCQACLLLESGSNPDFHRIAPVGASIGIDEIREIQGDVSLRPMYSKRKVYVIEDAGRMTVQAQNCLLKTLEEPPPYVVILLTVSNCEAMLETIRSRSLRLNFRKNTNEQVRKILSDRYGSGVRGIDFITAYADGIPGIALELAGSEDFALLREKTIGMLSKMDKSSLSVCLGLFSFFEENRDNVDIIFGIMTAWYRDLLVAAETGNENMLINSDKKDIIFINAKACKPRKLLALIEQTGEASRALKQNANYQLVIDNMLIKLRED